MINKVLNICILCFLFIEQRKALKHRSNDKLSFKEYIFTLYSAMFFY